MDGAGGPPVLTVQEAQAELGALSPRQQVAVAMLIQSREAFAAEQRAARPVTQSRVAIEPDEPQGPVGEDAYIEAAAPGVGGAAADEDRRPPPASMEEHRARLIERAAMRSHPGGIDTRQMDEPPQPQLTHADVFAIAEQVANAVLSRYDATRVPPFATAVSPAVAVQAPVFGAYLPPAPAPGQPARPFTPWAYRR